jgi:hypothetical protein
LEAVLDNDNDANAAELWQRSSRMKDEKIRQVVFFDLTLDTSPPGRLPAMDDVANFLIERINAGLCSRMVERERFLISIEKGKIVQKADGTATLALLFIFVDPDAADPANMHLQTKRVRWFEKLEGEGRAISAHALLDLTPRHENGRIFRVLLEHAERLGKTRVRAEIHNHIKQMFKDKEITVETADGDDVIARPSVQLHAIANERLRAGIAEGTLQEVKLIDTHIPEGGFDAPEPVVIKRREMALKVEVPIGQRVDDVLNLIRPWARGQGFDEMYVRWMPALPDDEAVAVGVGRTPQAAKINLEQDDIGETLYARKEFVSLENALSDLSTEISDELIGAMLPMLD